MQSLNQYPLDLKHRNVLGDAFQNLSKLLQKWQGIGLGKVKAKKIVKPLNLTKQCLNGMYELSSVGVLGNSLESDEFS